jgi:C4-dicarboxylate transporter DctQ subunit
VFNRILDRLEEGLIASLMGLATIVIFVSVMHRFLSSVPVIQDYTLRMNLTWAQELCIYMFVWMAKFGAAYGVRTGIHVGVDVVLRKLPEPQHRWLVVIGLLAGALFTGTVGTLGATFVWENGAHYASFHALGLATGDLPEGPTTPDLEWPTWIVYSAVPLGSYLMCFRFLQVTRSFLRSGELPHHDHGHVEGMEELQKEPLLIGEALTEGEEISREGNGKGVRK